MKLRVIPSKCASDAFDALQYLRRLITARETGLQELEHLLDDSRKLLIYLLRRTTPLDTDPAGLRRVERVRRFLSGVVSSGYLTGEEREVGNWVKLELDAFISSLMSENPKGEILGSLLAAGPGRLVITPGEPGRDELGRLLGARSGHEVLAATEALRSEEAIEKEVIITGWSRQERMAELLEPPIAPAVTLVLYELESRWFSGLCEKRERRRKARRTRSSREVIFPGVRGWKKHATRGGATTPTSTGTEAFEELESLHREVRHIRRRRLLEHARQEGRGEEVTATLLHFADGSHAFLTSTYRARVATHLVGKARGKNTGARSEVIERLPGELRSGDYLLFLEGAGTDVIREMADRSLPAGTRDTATLWKGVLRRFVEKEQLDARGLWKRLSADPRFTHHAQTVRSWIEDEFIIAPRDAHDHELDVIAAVTGDAELKLRLKECSGAVTDVWGEHLKAAKKLAEDVLRSCSEKLGSGEDIEGGRTEVTERVVLVRISRIDSEPVQVSRSVVNRLKRIEE